MLNQNIPHIAESLFVDVTFHVGRTSYILPNIPWMVQLKPNLNPPPCYSKLDFPSMTQLPCQKSTYLPTYLELRFEFHGMSCMTFFVSDLGIITSGRVLDRWYAHH